MIAAVLTEAQRQAFSAAIAPWPGLHAAMGRDLTIWADNPGAPVKLYLLYQEDETAPPAALTVRGKTVTLCGPITPRRAEEVGAFIGFIGAEKVQSTQTVPGWTPQEHLYLYTMPRDRLMAPCPIPEGFSLRHDPPRSEMRELLFAQRSEGWDAYYVATNAALSRGMERIWLLRYTLYYTAIRRDPVERALREMDMDPDPMPYIHGLRRQVIPAATVAAGAIFDGEAYLEMGYTAPAFRGLGLFRTVLSAACRELAEQGCRTTLLCKKEVCGLYENCGFEQTGKYYFYNTNCIN